MLSRRIGLVRGSTTKRKNIRANRSLKNKKPPISHETGGKLFRSELSSLLLRGPHLRPPRLLCSSDPSFSSGAHASAFDRNWLPLSCALIPAQQMNRVKYGI